MKNKFYSLLIISGFAIGFTSCILIALFINSENNKDTHFANYKTIYRLYDKKNPDTQPDYKFVQSIKSKIPEVKDACALDYEGGYETITIKDSESKKYICVENFAITSNEFFKIFSIPVISSLGATPFNGENSAVITQSTAKQLFGKQNPLGRNIEFDSSKAIITAVVKDLPANSSFDPKLFVNIANKGYRFSINNYCGHRYYSAEIYLQLYPHCNIQTINSKLNQFINPPYYTQHQFSLQNLSKIYLSQLNMDWDTHKKGNPTLLLIFLSIGILILLLSCINYLNYILSMQYANMKETGIQKTNGADNKQLLINALIQISIGIFLALLIAIGLTFLLLPYTDKLFGSRIFLSNINFRSFLPVFFGTIAGIILLNSLAPIYLLSNFNIKDFLAGSLNRQGKQIGKQIMITFQLTASIALIAIVLIVIKELNFVKYHNIGFNQEHLLKIDLPYTSQNTETLRQEMQKLSFVKSASLSNGYPGNINLEIEDITKARNGTKNHFTLETIDVSNSYLKTMGIQLLQGRDFRDGDQKKTCLINQTALRHFGWKNINGKYYNHQYKVIGVIKDFNTESLRSSIKPTILTYYDQTYFDTLSLRLSQGNLSQQINQLKITWHKFFPNDPILFNFYNDIFQNMYQKDEKMGKAIFFFSITALILTCMGILSHLFSISITKTKEIGIRKVNGARIFEIIALLNKDLIKWLIIAYLIAIPFVLFITHKWLENFAYKTRLNWWLFAISGLLALIIVLVTVSWQSWRAATKNPVEALHYE